MADDASDVDAEVQAIGGIENHPYGFIFVRIWRLLKTARTVLQDHEARIRKLEGTKP
jgi:hypothetical protein